MTRNECKAFLFRFLIIWNLYSSRFKCNWQWNTHNFKDVKQKKTFYEEQRFNFSFIRNFLKWQSICLQNIKKILMRTNRKKIWNINWICYQKGLLSNELIWSNYLVTILICQFRQNHDLHTILTTDISLKWKQCLYIFLNNLVWTASKKKNIIRIQIHLR